MQQQFCREFSFEMNIPRSVLRFHSNLLNGNEDVISVAEYISWRNLARQDFWLLLTETVNYVRG